MPDLIVGDIVSQIASTADLHWITDQIDVVMKPLDMWELCYDTAMGSTARKFHKGCDNLGPTVTIIKLDSGLTVAAFAPNSWRSARNGYIDGRDSAAVIMSLSKKLAWPDIIPTGRASSSCMTSRHQSFALVRIIRMCVNIIGYRRFTYSLTLTLILDMVTFCKRMLCFYTGLTSRSPRAPGLHTPCTIDSISVWISGTITFNMP